MVKVTSLIILLGFSFGVNSDRTEDMVC